MKARNRNARNKKDKRLGHIFYIFGFIIPMMLDISNAFGSEKDLYDFLWLDRDKKVYVLQHKVYKKKHHFYANVGFIKGLNDNYQDSTGFQLKSGFYLHEQWALELVYHQYNNKNNENFKNLKEVNGAVAFVRKIQKKYGAFAIYSPFYGKINTFNKIIYFDWSFGIGLGQIQTASNATTVSNSTTADSYATENNSAILAKTALRIHVTKNIHVGIEYSRDNYQAPGPTLNGIPGAKSWRTNTEMAFSVGFSF